MTTVREIVEDALRNLEELGEGQAMTAQQGQDGLRYLVDMIDSWSIEAGMIFTETKETFTVTGNDNDYTIGTGGNFNTTRPIRIRSAVLDEASSKTSLNIIGQGEYAQRYDGNDVGEPEDLYYDGNYPLGTIRLYPIPDTSYQLTLYSEKPLTTYTSLNDVVSLPQGWARGLKANLAIEMAPQYGKEPKQSLVNAAMESKRFIRNQNIQNDMVTSRVDDALVAASGFNIYSGDV